MRDYREERYNQPHRLDLGDGHYGDFLVWKPDRELNPQYDGIPDLEPSGLSIWHRDSNGAACVGVVNFASRRHAHVFGNQPTWQVVSLDPLHLEPSVLCECGDHGFIRDGRWVSA